MKKIFMPLSILFVLLLTTACRGDLPVGEVKIRFLNETGYDLNNIMVQEQEIGDLKDGKSSKSIHFESFRFDGGMPDSPIQGEIDGQICENFHQFYWCGTEKYTVEEGNYEMKILLRKIDKENFLQLQLIDE